MVIQTPIVKHFLRHECTFQVLLCPKFTPKESSSLCIFYLEHVIFILNNNKQCLKHILQDNQKTTHVSFLSILLEHKFLSIT